MKFGFASWVTAAVCALAGAAWAAGDPKACNEGVKQACIEIGTAVANEPPAGDVDELRADCEKTQDKESCSAWFVEEVKAGCRSGKQAACRTLGESEARRIADEAAPPIEALEASCKKKKQKACVDLAVRIFQDDPSEEGQRRSQALLERSCKAGFGDACARLGTLIVFSGDESDMKRGITLMKRACKLGSKAGCAFQKSFKPPQPKVMKPGEKSTGVGLLGSLGATEDIGQTMKNMAKLGKLLEQNCKLGYTDACAELRDPADPDPDPAKEKTYTSAEIAAKIRKLEKQAAAGPAKK